MIGKMLDVTLNDREQRALTPPFQGSGPQQELLRQIAARLIHRTGRLTLTKRMVEDVETFAEGAPGLFEEQWGALLDAVNRRLGP